MKRRWVLLMVVIISLVVLSALIPSMQKPEIYKKTPAEYTTPFHTDPGLYTKSDLNSSESSFLLMQDMLDITGPLTLNIRISDPESAAEDLARYRGLFGSMDKLVVKIEMSQSDLEEYLATHKDNEKILSDLLNETQDLSRLKELEIQFTDQDKPGSYISVIYQESAIRNRISELYKRYHANREVVNTTASKYGLNTTEYEASLENFAAIVGKEAENQMVLNTQVTEIKKAIANQTKDFLTMEISPQEARYRDLVTVRGILKSAKNRLQSVTMNIDNRDSTETMTGFSGEYEFHYLINKIPPGRHTVYVSNGGIFSNPGSFTVIAVNSVTTLTVPAVSDKPSVNITGSLYTNQGIPVIDAPVTIAWDRTNTTDVTTGDDGKYTTVITLPNGNHTVQAIFQGVGYPINPSKSQVSKISVNYQEPAKEKTFPWLPIAVLSVALVISSGAAVLYLRRRGVRSFFRPEIPDTPDGDTIATTGSLEEGPLPENDDMEDLEIQPGLGHGGFEQKRKELGFQDVAYERYREIITLVHDSIPLSVARSLTTREFVELCQGKPYYQVLWSFISLYEWIRYGPGALKRDDETRFMDESANLIDRIRGDNHS